MFIYKYHISNIMNTRNRGIQKEQEAKEHIRHKFGFVKKHISPTDFYDYLTFIENQRYYIEVKYYNIPKGNRSANIRIRYNQFINLINQKNFLIYVMTNKGNKFITKKKLFQFAHQHYNKLNPHEKNIIFNVKEEGKLLRLSHLRKCKYCDGSITKWQR